MIRLIFSILLITVVPAAAFADLFTDSQNASSGTYSTYQKSNGTTTFAVGAVPPTPYSSYGDAISLGAGLESKAGCGGFDIIATIKSVFNKEVLDQYVSGLASSIVSNAPMLLLCYTSQTLCDLYKHFRNMANAALALRNAQCQQIEKLAVDTGNSLRSSSQARCLNEHQASGEDLDAAIAACRATVNNITVPSTGGTTASYNLTDEIIKTTGMSGESQSLIKAIMGDAVVSVQTGTGSTSMTPNVYEKLISAYTADYNSKLTTLLANFKATWEIPSSEDIAAASTPAFPLHPSTMRTLAFMDDNTRATVTAQLASLYGMTRMYYELEEVSSKMAIFEENPNIGTKEERERLQRDQKRLRDQLALIEKRVEMETKYIAPALQALESSNPIDTGKAQTDQEFFRDINITKPGPLGR